MPSKAIRRVALAALIATWAMPGPASAAQPARVADADLACAHAVRRHEIQHGIPAHLLAAISLSESGRWRDGLGQSVPWPWTVNNGGVGRFFPTKAAAIAEVRRLQQAGEWNIDVGCMQINLHHHPDAFASIEQALDPSHNVAYAADFLSRLKRRGGTWLAAAARYHSATPHLAQRYEAKLVRHWNALRQAGPLTAVAAAPATGSEPAWPTPARTPPAPRDPTVTPPWQPAPPATTAFRLPPTPPDPAVDARRAADEQARAEARQFAEDWRAARLAEYLEQRARRLAADG